MGKDDQINKSVVMLEKWIPTDKADRHSSLNMSERRNSFCPLVNPASPKITQQPGKTVQLCFNIPFCRTGLFSKVFAPEVFNHKRNLLNQCFAKKLIQKSLSFSAVV